MRMARDAGREFVVGFIAMSRDDLLGKRGTTSHQQAQSHLNEREGVEQQEEEEEDWLILTPGVGLEGKGDGKGQQYRTPREVVYDCGCDVIIVGRGIYGVKGGEEAIKKEAERYRMEGWKAYEERLKR